MVIGQPLTIEFGKKKCLSSRICTEPAKMNHGCLNILQGISEARSTTEQELEGLRQRLQGSEAACAELRSKAEKALGIMTVMFARVIFLLENRLHIC
jgi:hypothetical protein